MSDHAEGSNAAAQRKTRGSRACAPCRKGKNRCVVPDGSDGPCERCRNHGIPCVFEPRPSRASEGGLGAGLGGVHADDRFERLEDTVHALTTAVSQLVQAQQYQYMHAVPPAVEQPHYPLPAPQQVTSPATSLPLPGPPQLPQPERRHSYDTYTASASHDRPSKPSKRKRGDAFPELPGYKAPPHPALRYGIADSNAPSSDDEEVMQSTQLTAPFEALAEAAAAASMASNASSAGTPRSLPNTGTTATNANQHAPGSGTSYKRRKKSRAAPPPNAFPSVVQKGLVTEQVAKRMFAFYIDQMHPTFPILDPNFDTFESLHERSPWSINAILSVAGQRMPNPDPDVVKATECATEEAHGIARSSLFGPTVRKEGAQAMAIISAWQENGYMAAGHALRMTHDLGLHRALVKLAESSASASANTNKTQAGNPSNNGEDERELLASARIYINAYWLDSVLSAGAGRPAAGEPVSTVASRIHYLVQHKLAIKSDYVLAANIDLLRLRSELEASVSETSKPGLVCSHARQAVDRLKTWWREWDDRLGCYFDGQSFERKMLLCSLYAAEMALISAALRFQSLNGREALTGDVRDLVMSARQSAASYIDITLDSHALRHTLRYCLHSAYANAAYSGLLLLKFARLWPADDEAAAVVSRCNQLQHLLSTLPGASRFALTIRNALERFAAHFGVPYTPRAGGASSRKYAQTAATPGIGSFPNQQQPQPYPLNGYGASNSSAASSQVPQLVPGLSTAQSQSHSNEGIPFDPSSSSVLGMSTSALPPGASNGMPFTSGADQQADASSPFDLNAFLANDWTTGHGQRYPEWLRADASADKQDWAFSDVLSTGLDGLFLPTWTLQLDQQNGGETWAAQ